ncbi:CDP-glycerol:glycerophosphate glycerophosphotransferase [Campylobacter jejuni]|uniref:CDP-glycerol glycerophosphotransferase family protein n=1 Tax=Campylobacter jejuni TaxID=197 RepID=UPI00089416F6|nr:CDP-glycerol glycerophosphotransferase family protein [Campylobacter jejuni]OEZ07796.1 capsular biosynthesis protein [Campylobacter jejuni]HAA2157381.1 capsular biosynthesis protein [Campylobacter jejuni]HAA2180686.1 capsular biosynthesis protein [Campylobacter jejuni]
MLLKAKYKKNISFFFKSLLISLENFLKQFKPKKYKAYNKYVIVSAVYNVEKYLDDFFKSIINQKLDFKSNIHLICVNDGSTDNSANIIKKYQKKYPKNIIYLYKENGGQASARNLGLKYLKENDLNILWVTFTDPDDFLDRDYFYEVDSFLKKQNNIAMVATNIIFYREKRKILYKDTHALNFKFKRQKSVYDNIKLNENIQLSVASCFLRCDYLKDTFFDENLTLNFEDGKFINIYLFKNLNLKSVFLKNARYFYRKRFDKSFSLNKKNENKIYYLEILEKRYLELLNCVVQQDKIPTFIQNVILYEIFWQTQELVNHPEKLSFMDQVKIHKYLDLLDKIFYFINIQSIMKFNFNSFLFLYKMGFVYCFKKEKVPIDKVFIEQIDDKNDEILIKFYTADVNDEIKMLFDDRLAKIICSKIRQYDFLNRVFIYERRIWLKFFINAKNMICFINDKKVDIIYQEKKCTFYDIFYEIKKLKKRRAKNKSLWLFADMSYRADDNAEHLYRYVMKNHPEKNIAFVLRKNSHDYKRLKKEGFKLVDPKSFKFKYLVFKADKLISSHIDRYFFEALGENTLKTKDFVFLQHGITQNDLSSWLNQRQIDLFITGMQDEYDSIAGDFNRYKFTPKEVKLTGFPRWDALLKNNQINTKQIIIMPTWREYIVGSYSKKLMKRRFNPKFYESEYFYRWGSFLHSKKLQELHEKYNYKIVFNPHPQIRPYLEDFNLPNYIIIPSVEMSMQKLFCESSLMITDYSSVAFEMIILKKPVIYYQFDQDYFFYKHFLKRGYYNYKKMEFSYLVNNQKDLIFYIEFLLAHKI